MKPHHWPFVALGVSAVIAITAVIVVGSKSPAVNAPILFGIDKFAEVLTDNCTQYLATEFNDILPGSAQGAMYLIGGVEIVAGLVVLVAPRFGGLLVAGWLAGVILSLLLVGGYGDIALRDFGLLLGALTLARLATAFDKPRDSRT